MERERKKSQHERVISGAGAVPTVLGRSNLQSTGEPRRCAASAGSAWEFPARRSRADASHVPGKRAEKLRGRPRAAAGKGKAWKARFVWGVDAGWPQGAAAAGFDRRVQYNSVSISRRPLPLQTRPRPTRRGGAWAPRSVTRPRGPMRHPEPRRAPPRLARTPEYSGTVPLNSSNKPSRRCVFRAGRPRLQPRRRRPRAGAGSGTFL